LPSPTTANSAKGEAVKASWIWWRGIDDLLKVPGIRRALAERILDHLNSDPEDDNLEV
jgi:hypothetical protein